MARTTLDISISGYSDGLDEQIRQTLISHHYKEIPYYSEIVWKKGTGMMTAMHYIKVEYPDYQTVRLSGWVQIGIGSVGGKERDLTGLTGAIPKRSVLSTMHAIQAMILQYDQENPTCYGCDTAEPDEAVQPSVPDAMAAASIAPILNEADSTEADPVLQVPEEQPEEALPAEEPISAAMEPELPEEPDPAPQMQASGFVIAMQEQQAEQIPPQESYSGEEPAPAASEPEPPAPTAQKQPKQAATAQSSFTMVMNDLPDPHAVVIQTTQNQSAEEPVPAVKEPEQHAAPSGDTPFTRAAKPVSESFLSDRKFFLWLSDASFAGELPQNQSEYFAVDTRTEQPYYILAQHGKLPGQNRYEIKEPITWEELEAYGNPAQKARLGIAGGWKETICAVQKTETSITVLWRKNAQCLEEASVLRKADGFSFVHSEKGGLNDPTAKGTKTSLIPQHYRSETAFRIAVQSKLTQESVIQLLWDFLQESLQTPFAEPAPAEDPQYQAEQAFQRGGLERDQAYGQQNLQPDGTPITQNTAEPTPPPAEPVPEQPPKKIIFCQNCGCKLKIPDKKVKLHVVCPKCKFDFYHKA